MDNFSLQTVFYELRKYISFMSLDKPVRYDFDPPALSQLGGKYRHEHD
jgi:hypothetical protein